MRRHELNDEEGAVIEPMLRAYSRDVKRVDDRPAVNRILWRLRTGRSPRDGPANDALQLLPSLAKVRCLG